MEGWLGLLIDVLRNGYKKGAMNVWLDKSMHKMDAGGQIDGCLSSVHNSSNLSMPIHPPADLLIHSFIRVSYSSNHPSIQRTDGCQTDRGKVIKVLKVYGVLPSWLCMGRVSAAPAQESRVPVRRVQLQAVNKSFSFNKRCVYVSLCEYIM